MMIDNENYPNCTKGTKVTIGRMKGNILAGDKIYKIESKQLNNIAEESYKTAENKKILLNAIIDIKKNSPITMTIICANNRHSNTIYHNIKLKITSSVIPEEAKNYPITKQRIIKQISKTKNTPFEFENISINLDDNLYIPNISSLNELRRKGLQKLMEIVIHKKQKRDVSLGDLSIQTSSPNKTLENPKISLFFRNLSNENDYSLLDKEKINNVYIFLKLFLSKDYEKTIKYLSENYNVYIYMPTIIKTNYRNIILNSLEKILKTYTIKGFIISNIADFELLNNYHNKYDFIGNYSLNVFNSISIEEYKKLGLSRVTLSRELSKNSIIELLSLENNIDKELIVYGNLPLMTTNYCPLGKTNICYPTCNQYCLKNNKYYLKDRLRVRV